MLWRSTQNSTEAFTLRLLSQKSRNEAEPTQHLMPSDFVKFSSNFCVSPFTVVLFDLCNRLETPETLHSMALSNVTSWVWPQAPSSLRNQGVLANTNNLSPCGNGRAPTSLARLVEMVTPIQVAESRTLVLNYAHPKYERLASRRCWVVVKTLRL